MGQSIFSQYSQGENRVTASILAVLKSLAIPRTDRLLQGLIGEASVDLFHFSNQPPGAAGSIPDARISASFRIDIETKVKMNFQLLAPDATATVELDRAVINDMTTEKASGRTVAFTQNQRYVPMSALRKAKSTSDLAQG